MKQVLITTAHRGVFAGEISPKQDLTAKQLPLKNARMAIRWGTVNGVMELCETGPTNQSKISEPANISMLHDITAVFEITPKAWKKWLSI